MTDKKKKPTAESNAEAIDKMRDYVYRGDKSLEKRFTAFGARIKSLVDWAEETKPDLEQIKGAVFEATADNADGIAFELAALREKRRESAGEYKQALLDKGNLTVDIVEFKRKIEELCAPMGREISFELIDPKAEKSKFKYSNEADRKRALVIAQNDSDEYKSLIAQQRNAERALAQARAIIEHLDAERKTWGRKIDSLIAQLDNLTARFK